MLTVLRSVTKAIGRELLRWRDRLRRNLAIWFFDRPTSTKGVFSDEVVFIRWDAKLGDTVVLSWVWRELMSQRPDLRLSVITNSAFEDLFRAGFGLQTVYVAPKRHGWRRLARIARQIGRPKYVVHLAAELKARDMFFIQQLRPAHVIGLDDELRLVDIKLGAATAGCHFSEKLIPWLKSLGVKPDHRSYWVPNNATAARSVAHWWPDGPVVGLCPFGASKRRHLNVDFVLLLVNKLLGSGAKVVLLVAPSFRTAMQELIRQHGWQESVFLSPASASLHELFEQVRCSAAIVSVDTAVVHLASAFKRPTLAFYDGTDLNNFNRWHPNSDAATVIMVPGAIAQTGELVDEGKLDVNLEALLSTMRPVPDVDCSASL